MNKSNYSIERMCKVLKVSRSCYYRWYTSNISIKYFKNQRLTQVIKQVFEKSKSTYGSTRITANLKRQGYYVSRPRVSTLMRKEGLRSKIRRRFRVTTNSNHRYSISKNHLSRNFKPKTLNETWVSDITYIKTGQCWLYLTSLLKEARFIHKFNTLQPYRAYPPTIRK